MREETKKTWVNPVLKDISVDKTNSGTFLGGTESSHFASLTYQS